MKGIKLALAACLGGYLIVATAAGAGAQTASWNGSAPPSPAKPEHGVEGRVAWPSQRSPAPVPQAGCGPRPSNEAPVALAQRGGCVIVPPPDDRPRPDAALESELARLEQQALLAARDRMWAEHRHHHGPEGLLFDPAVWVLTVAVLGGIGAIGVGVSRRRRGARSAVAGGQMCPACGAAGAAGDRFCQHCGTRFTSAT
jgi:hypothetical protein